MEREQISMTEFMARLKPQNVPLEHLKPTEATNARSGD